MLVAACAGAAQVNANASAAAPAACPIRAANVILDGGEYQLRDVTGASLGGGFVTKMFDWAMTRGA